MRVTANAFSSSLIAQLNQLSTRQYQLQNQVSTGQRITAPEDDPIAMQRTMDLNTAAAALQQRSTNISNLQDRSTLAYNSLKSLKTLSDRVGELATQADGTRSPEELKSYATEITQIIQQAAQLMNTKGANGYLFGGTQTDQPPFAVTTDANGNVTGVTYQGNSNVASSEIEPGVTLAVDVPGANTTGTGPRGMITDSRSGADLFNHLISLQNHLLAGDTASIAATDRSDLSKDEDNLTYQIGTIGAVQTRLDSASSAASTQSDSLSQMISKEAGADITSTLVQLNQAQYAYQAALQSSTGLLQRSLLNYL
ncbi:MAG TPA: flagellar hook-associated protein FlgL [Dongiaceae bacterium]|jgi:flagellar hook-associated protein 3 FlgL|nr:flagellar hook-associated protein FlgL [Dongiaceae bacterium]